MMNRNLLGIGLLIVALVAMACAPSPAPTTAPAATSAPSQPTRPVDPTCLQESAALSK